MQFFLGQRAGFTLERGTKTADENRGTRVCPEIVCNKMRPSILENDNFEDGWGYPTYGFDQEMLHESLCCSGQGMCSIHQTPALVPSAWYIVAFLMDIPNTAGRTLEQLNESCLLVTASPNQPAISGGNQHSSLANFQIKHWVREILVFGELLTVGTLERSQEVPVLGHRFVKSKIRRGPGLKFRGPRDGKCLG